MISSICDSIRISGISVAVPNNSEKIRDSFADKFGYDSVEKFCNLTGVNERRVASFDQTSSDLAFVSAEELIKKMGVEKGDIGVCVFVTQTPDYVLPSTACILQFRLGLPNDCIAFDVNLGCSGYVYGIQLVSSLLKSIESRFGLLLVGETNNKFVGKNDRSSAMLFGDAGSATLLEKHENSHLIRGAFRTDGSRFKSIIIPAGSNRNRNNVIKNSLVRSDGNVRSDYDLYMNGADVFSFSITEVPELFKEFLTYFDIDKSQIDCYVFHQANYYILKQLAKRCDIQIEKMHISLDRYGNTSVASIPLTICDRYGKREEQGEKHILASGFGVGLSWGIIDFVVDANCVFPISETDDLFLDGAVDQ